MKGIPVIVLFILINVLVVSIFLGILSNSARKSILEQETLARQTLNEILAVYKDKNIAASNFLGAISVIPRIDSYLLSTFSNYLDSATLISESIDSSIIEKPLTFQHYQYLQARIQERVSQINDTARNYPVLRTNEFYMKARNDITPLETQVRSSITRYNEYILEYNKLASRFPSNIVAGILGKFPFLTFEIGTNIIQQTSYLFE